MIKIPQNKKWPQLNQGDLLGVLSSTRNVELNSPGVVRLAQRTLAVAQTNSGNFADVRAMEFFDSKYRLASDRVYNLDANLTNFGADGTANTPDAPVQDMAVWNYVLYASKADRVSALFSNGVWVQDRSDADFTNTGADFPHPLEPNVTNENILVGDGKFVKTIDSNGVIGDGTGGAEGITVPAEYNVNWIRRGTTTNYIGLVPKTAASVSVARGAVAAWDGTDTTLGYNFLIPLNCRGALSAVVDDNGVLNIITTDGRLMKFNGSGFSYLAELPPFRDFLARRAWGGSAVVPKILQRGMQVIKGKIHVAVNAHTATQIMQPEFQSGVWVYDEDNKAFYLKYTASNSATVTDFGQSVYSSGPWALYPLIDYDEASEGSTTATTPPADTAGSGLLFGARLYPNTIAGTALRTLVSATTGTNRGSFVTNRIESQSITDNDVAIWCKFRGVTTSNDKILFKYRTSAIDPFVLTNGVPTWTSTTVFTTTDTKMADALAGDEVTILTGNGAGSMAHISSIVLNAGTYTVTLDEAITNISNNDTSWVMVDRWTKAADTITSADTQGQKRISINIPQATWVQIKVELRGEGERVEIQELTLVNKTQQPII